MERSVAHGGCLGVHCGEVIQNGGRGYFRPCWEIHFFSPIFSSFFGSKSKAGEFLFFPFVDVIFSWHRINNNIVNLGNCCEGS